MTSHKLNKTACTINALLTRREFVGKAVTGVCVLFGVLPIPGAVRISDFLHAGDDVDTLWVRTKTETVMCGEAIAGNVVAGSSKMVPDASVAYTTGYAELLVYINGVSDKLAAVAVYDVTNIIATVYNIYLVSIYGKHDVANLTCSYARIDGGRTLAVQYSCSLTNTLTRVSVVTTFYAEFYRDGSGWLKS